MRPFVGVMATVFAVNTGAAQSTPGHWVVTTVKPSKPNPALTPMLDQMTEIMTVLRRDPAVDHPAGYTVSARVWAEQSSPKTMVNGTLRAFFIAGASDKGEGEDFSIIANNLSCARGERTDYKDAAGEFYSAVTPTTFRGVRMYRDNSCIVLTNRTAPITVPVSRERLGRVLVKFYDENPDVVRAIQRELSAMTTVQRASPAILDHASLVNLQMHVGQTQPVFAEREGESAFRIVAANPDFYDHARISDIQAIVVNFSCGGKHDSPFCAGFPGVFEHLRDAIDLDALSRMLK